jgi:hypothetical protein
VDWSIGNGADFWLWKDNWLEGFRPLINHVLQEIPKEILNVTAVEMVSITN